MGIVRFADSKSENFIDTKKVNSFAAYPVHTHNPKLKAAIFPRQFNIHRLIQGNNKQQ